jgi:pimeloyl-ACP methyl ester carboxylesterase
MAPSLLVGLAAALYPLRGFERAVFSSTARLFSAASQVLGLRFDETSVVRVLLESTGSLLDDEGVEHYRRLFAQPQHVSAVLAMMAHWDLSRLFSDLSSLGPPMLLIAGTNDKAVPLSQQRLLERRVPTSQLKVLADAGHLLHEEQPKAVVRLILEEVNRVSAGPRAIHWGSA